MYSVTDIKAWLMVHPGTCEKGKYSVSVKCSDGRFLLVDDPDEADDTFYSDASFNDAAETLMEDINALAILFLCGIA